MKVNRILDFRLRPPYGMYTRNYLFTNIDDVEKLNACSYANATCGASAKACSMELLLQEMQSLNIKKAIMPIRRAGVLGKKNTENGNGDAVKITQEYPDIFGSMAGLDVNDPIDVALAEIEQYVVNGPCCGIVLEPALAAVPMYVDDKALYPIYEKCQEHEIVINFTYGGLGAPDHSFYVPERLERIALDFPRLNIVACHGGWPWTSGILSVAFQRSNVYVCPDTYIRGMVGSHDYVDGANYALQDKIIFGSAYPVISLYDSVESHLYSGIRDEILPKIMYDNAAKLLKLQ